MSEKQTPDEQPRPQTAAAKTGKKPYTPPALVEYGSVAKLTLGSLTTQTDSPQAGKKKACL